VIKVESTEAYKKFLADEDVIQRVK